MKTHFNFLTWIVLTMALLPSAFAEEGLSLEQALRVAFAQNPQMTIARKELSGSKGRWMQAEALPDPELEMDIGGLKEGENSVGSIAVKQPLDPLGIRFLRGRIAYDEVKITKNAVAGTWAEIATKVTETYVQILAEEKAIEVSEQNLKATRQFLTLVESRFQSGNALKSNLLRAKIEVSRAENDFLVSQKNLKVSKGELNLLMGRSIEAPLVLSDILDYEPLKYQYETLIEQAVKDRVDVKNEKIRLDSKKKSFWSAVLATFFPKMSVGLERTTEDYDNDTALLLEASYPLWGFNLGKVKEAKAEKEKQQVRFEAFKKEVGLEVYKGFLEAELADKQVSLQKKSVDEANELLRQITLQYEEGEVQFLTYLENIKAIKDTRLSYFTALKNFKAKVSELEKAIQAIQPPQGEKLP